jgi:signal transduction histidine kinase
MRAKNGRPYTVLARWGRAAFSIRTKFAVLSFVVVFVPIYLLNRHALRVFDEFTSRALEEEMISHARFLGEQFRLLSHEAPDPVREERFQSMLQSLGPQLQSRLRILSVDGVVRYDSSSTPMVGRDISSYREVSRAKAGAYGARWRMTPDNSYVYYYIALPIVGESGPCGIAHVLRHTGPIIKTIKRMAHEQDVTLFISLLAALLLSLIVAQTLTRRLRRLTSCAREFTRSGRFTGHVGGRDEIAALGQAMSRMTEDLDRRSIYNREFVATLMHELKAPLTAIRGAAEVLEDGAAEKPVARAKFFGNIRFEVDRVSRLVGELSDLTKLDNELASEAPDVVDYLLAIGEIRDRLPMLFDGAHAPVMFELPLEASICVGISAARLEQVLVNLLDNAMRYTPVDGQITIRVVVPVHGEVCTTLSDTGSGIAPANLSKVFDRFFTTEPKGRRQEAGSGLGLAVVKSIVACHHGTITVASDLGAGTTFTMRLPTA